MGGEPVEDPGDLVFGPTGNSRFNIVQRDIVSVPGTLQPRSGSPWFRRREQQYSEAQGD
jgi:hypothetical protein